MDSNIAAMNNQNPSQDSHSAVIANRTAAMDIQNSAVDTDTQTSTMTAPIVIAGTDSSAQALTQTERTGGKPAVSPRHLPNELILHILKFVVVNFSARGALRLRLVNCKCQISCHTKCLT